MRTLCSLLGLWLVSALLCAPCLTGDGRAATFNVPAGDVTVLISTLNVANVNDQADVINLAAGSVYTLSAVDNTTNGPNGLPIIADDVAGQDVTINGNGATIVRSSPSDFRILDVEGSATISGLTIANGRVTGAAGTSGSPSGGDGQGGGLFNNGTLNLINCTLRANAAIGGGAFSSSGAAGEGQGGALYNAGTLTLKGCTLHANAATGGRGGDSGVGGSGGVGIPGQGGALFNSAGALSLVNCTLSGNTVTGGRGGDSAVGGFGGNSLGGGIASYSTLTLTNCTVSGNVALGGPGGDGDEPAPSGFGVAGGLHRGAGTATVRATIVAGNIAANNPDVNSAFSSAGFNLIGTTAGSSGWVASDLIDAAAAPLNLGPLQDNGGPTLTRALLSGSVAIDSGDDTVLGAPLNLTTDQRGLPRKLGGHVDIGAFEFDAATGSTTLVVTTTHHHDDGTCGAQDCTLLEALNAANANEDANIINFKAGLSGTITNTSLPIGPTIIYPVTINGPGARVLAVSGNNANRILTNLSGVVTISGLTLRDGLQQGAVGTPGSFAAGGAIVNFATLTLNNCTLRNNAARGGAGTDFSSGNGGLSQGGAIYNQGTLTLNRCTLSGNTAQGGAGGFAGIGSLGGSGGAAQGGAIYHGAGLLTLNNCTLSGNAATGGQGGGSEEGSDGSPGNGGNADGGGVAIVSTLTLTGGTLSGNTANGGAAGVAVDSIGAAGSGSGGGLWLSDGTATVRDTIVAGNSATTSGPNALGAFTSSGYNLLGDGSGSTGFTGTGDQVNVADAKLGALGNNGGPTDTRAPQSGSPAIDKGKGFGLATDQRGLARPYDNAAIANAAGGDGSDIGALEVQPLATTLSINDVTVAEGNAGTVNVVFTVTRNGDANGSASVHYATANGTATAPGDYSAVPDTVLTFSPGQSARTLTVVVNGDTLDEPDETFKVNLSNASGATLGDALGVGTITDNDATPRFFITDVTVAEGNAGTVAANFNLSLSAASGRTVTVTYKTADGTATAPSDYVAHPSTVLTFTPGQISKTITVLVNGDTLDEGNETFKVVLQSATFAAIVDNIGAGTITDDDPLPSLAISDAPAKAEGDTGSHNALFTVTLSAPSGRTVTVNYATQNGTATAGGDYTSASGTITFTPGQTSKTLPVAVLGDTAVEPDESFKVNLTGASFATISDSQGLHSVTNDDASE